MAKAIKTKAMSTKQVERACALVKCRAVISEYLSPHKTKANREAATSEWSWCWDDFFRNRPSEHKLPVDLQKKAARFLIDAIDAELAAMGVKP